MSQYCKVMYSKSPIKPHTFVKGVYNGQPRESCLHCGGWKDELEKALCAQQAKL